MLLCVFSTGYVDSSGSPSTWGAEADEFEQGDIVHDAPGAPGEVDGDEGPVILPNVLEELDLEFSLDQTNYPPKATSSAGSQDDDGGELLDWVDVSDCDSTDDGCDVRALPPELDLPQEYKERMDGEGRRLWEIHEPHMKGATVIEGGAQNLRYNEKASGSEYYPFPNLSCMLLNKLADDFQLSRRIPEGMLRMLRFEDINGRKFDTAELDSVHHEHFRARNRRFFPLLLALERKVSCSNTATTAGERESSVFDIPVNVILDRKLRSTQSVQEMLDNQGGKMLTEAETKEAGLSSQHIFSCPEVHEGNIRRTNMHGKLARTRAHFGFDGVKTEGGRGKVYVNDIAEC